MALSPAETQRSKQPLCKASQLQSMPAQHVSDTMRKATCEKEIVITEEPPVVSLTATPSGAVGRPRWHHPGTS